MNYWFEQCEIAWYAGAVLNNIMGVEHIPAKFRYITRDLVYVIKKYNCAKYYCTDYQFGFSYARNKNGMVSLCVIPM